MKEYIEKVKLTYKLGAVSGVLNPLPYFMRYKADFTELVVGILTGVAVVLMLLTLPLWLPLFALYRTTFSVFAFAARTDKAAIEKAIKSWEVRNARK